MKISGYTCVVLLLCFAQCKKEDTIHLSRLTDRNWHQYKQSFGAGTIEFTDSCADDTWTFKTDGYLELDNMGTPC
jgi:hypothetical protein